MALDQDTFDEVYRLVDECCDCALLNDWERNFIEDNKRRMDEYETKVFLSSKQIQIIRRIHREKVEGIRD